MSVVDANVLSALAKAERLDVLAAVFDDVATVAGVVDELDTVRHEGYDFVARIDHARDDWLGVVSPTTTELERAEDLRDETLSFVDATCLAVCAGREERLVTDDDSSTSSTDASREEFEALGDAGVVEAETAAKLAEAAGFRNFLAHRYGEVDHDIVYDVLHDDLHWFERFQHEVAVWLRDRLD